MRSVTVLLLLLTSALSCSARTAAPPAEPAPREPVSVVDSAPPLVNVTGCVAKPSTLYGDEPVVFELMGQSKAGASVPVEVLDLRGDTVFRGESQLPGTVNAGRLPSGDFSLKTAGLAVSCRATVNRELTRGTSDAR